MSATTSKSAQKFFKAEDSRYQNNQREGAMVQQKRHQLHSAVIDNYFVEKHG